jgi:hypothetical protein
MNDEQMQSLLDTWFEDTDPTPPDTRRTAVEVMARVPQTRQRGRLLPFPLFRRKAQPPTATDTTDYQPSPIADTNGHAPTVIGRTQTMFSPVKAITAGALVFALGGVLLIAQPFEQGGTAPGATTDEGIGEVTRFEGTMGYGTTSDEGDLEALPNGVIQTRGHAYTMDIVEMSDPRLDGVVSGMWNRDQRLSGDPVQVAVGGFRIENDDGAWQTRPIVDSTLPGPQETTWTVIFDGEGDYAGLTAIAKIVWGPVGWDLDGIVIDGEVPPPPDMSTE